MSHSAASSRCSPTTANVCTAIINVHKPAGDELQLMRIHDRFRHGAGMAQPTDCPRQVPKLLLGPTLIRSQSVFPTQEWRGRSGQERVRRFPEHGKGKYRGNDLSGLAELLTINQEIAKAF
jgi:hypothetical protein